MQQSLGYLHAQGRVDMKKIAQFTFFLVLSIGFVGILAHLKPIYSEMLKNPQHSGMVNCGVWYGSNEGRVDYKQESGTWFIYTNR